MNQIIRKEIIDNKPEDKDRRLCMLTRELQWWADFLNAAFLKDQPVPAPVLIFGRAKISTLGHYVTNSNAFGLREHINLNRANLDRPLWDIIATLLHEMCHGWQYYYGSPSNSWFHNREFQMKMREFGIIVNIKGQHRAVKDPFVFLLRKHGITCGRDIDRNGMIELPQRPRKKGKSKLKKWSCGCANIRVAISDLDAKCLKCGNRFEPIP